MNRIDDYKEVNLPEIRGLGFDPQPFLGCLGRLSTLVLRRNKQTGGVNKIPRVVQGLCLDPQVIGCSGHP